MKKTQKIYILTTFIILLLLSFVLIVSTSGLLFGRHKSDMTSLHRHSISKKSEYIAEQLKKQIHITIYMSENLADEYPSLGIHAQYVLRLLERYQMIAGTPITIDIRNPEPYSPKEKEALDSGIRPFPDNSGNNNLYFGAVFSNSEGKVLTIPYFSSQRQNYTEKDISRILSKLNDFKEKNIGIASFGDDPDDSWLITQVLKNDYNISSINTDIAEIPLTTDILIVINPQKINRMFLYALDQYILRGGKLLLLLDPDTRYSNRFKLEYSSNYEALQKLLKNLGITYNPEIVIGSPVLSKNERRNNQQEQDSILNINIGPKLINQNSELTKGFLRLSFRSAGGLQSDSPKDVSVTELFSAGDDVGTVPAVISKFGTSGTAYGALNKDNKKYALGYYIEGWFNSLFEKNILENTAFEQQMIPFVIGSIEKAQIIIISDSDFLSNETISHRSYAPKAGAYDLIPSSNNADFILRAVDFLAGNNDVIGIDPSYLYNSEYTTGEQLYGQVFSSLRQNYEDIENNILKEENALNALMANLKTDNKPLSIKSIKEIEGYNRKIQNLQTDLKHLNYLISKKTEEKCSAIIVLNTIVFPFFNILLIWGIAAYFKRCNYNRARRLINE